MRSALISWPAHGKGADIPGPRPHILGWGEFQPLILDPELACPLCGVKGSHNVITLGISETRAILKDMEKPE